MLQTGSSVSAGDASSPRRRLDVEDATAAIEELRECSYPSAAELENECDVVMKGGITSGVVYPLAVCELARQYRFRSIGGASAGAMAAALAAAAEKGRDSDGFSKLAALPEHVGRHLVSLFQPTPGTRPLFRVLLAGVHPTRRGWGKLPGVLWALAANRPIGFSLGTGGVLLVAGWDLPRSGGWWRLPRGLLIGVLAVVGGLAGAVLAHVRLGLREIPRNCYGLCSGSVSEAGNTTPPLTEWLTQTIDDLAGVSQGHGPLTFGDLWGAEAVSEWRRPVPSDAGRIRSVDSPADLARRGRTGRAINLEVMTTNVTHGRPSRMPFDTDIYMFCPRELRTLFPRYVMAKLVRDGDASTAKTGWSCPHHPDEVLWRLPDAPDLPVVVAVRMSLSFPMLMSAVPLYAVDQGRDGKEDGKPVRCWFSDGGISSNFPIHFFDSLWPGRPTFGVSLAPHQDHQTCDVYLPPPEREGGAPRLRATETLTGFLGAILDTMQNWSDEGQSTLPGYRDRIVEVHLSDDEGGMNLDMPKERVLLLAARGRLAAEKLRGFEFRRHQWTRYLTAMAKLQQSIGAMHERYVSLPNGSPGYLDLLQDPGSDVVYQRGPAWREAAVASTDILLRFVAPEEGDPPVIDFTSDAPLPDPDLRITAHF